MGKVVSEYLFIIQPELLWATSASTGSCNDLVDTDPTWLLPNESEFESSVRTM